MCSSWCCFNKVAWLPQVEPAAPAPTYWPLWMRLAYYFIAYFYLS